ncbi:MAG: zinc-binding dehydrogenase [Thermoplasmata archaeon]|nr:zinc-binding dehydrogenase [Thermoplasmata archaeon]
MRGVGFRSHGGLDHVEFVDIPTPTPGPGEVQVRLQAAAFNRLDLFTLAGIPGVPVAVPHVLGSDGAGIVESTGPDVADLDLGTPVLLNPGIWDGTCEACRAGEEALCRGYQIVGEHTQGTATEFVVVPRRNVYPKPPSLSLPEAAAAPLVFQTAWRAIRTVGALRADESCAIIGASGGVANAALQVAQGVGARVVVATRSEAHAARARTEGARDVLVYSEAEPIDQLLWRWSGKRGIDVIFDSVGRATLPRTVRAVARGGRVVVIGATSGPLAEIDLRTLFWRQASIRGSTMAGRAEFEGMLGALASGSLRPTIDRVFPFEKGREALARMESDERFGKVVLSIP